ncbi:MAG: site-2 protease family protein [Actinobacteria bacterium]|nr:site-2 protease family protein [Actinomycetota bacterium]
MISDSRVLDVALFLAVLLPSIVFHEVAHGWVAERLGDPTARRAGRITLNPLRHLDPFGSLLFPAVLAVAGQSVWGWARPVPVEPQHFRRPTEGMAVVALAGPASNLLLALVVARLSPLVDLRAAGGVEALGRGVYWEGLDIGVRTGALWGRVLFAVVLVNCALAVFNMLPIPPLDGSRLVPLVLPPPARAHFNRLAPYGFLVLFVLILGFPRALGFVGRAVGWLLRVMV